MVFSKQPVRKFIRYIIIIGATLAVVGGIGLYYFYHTVYEPNIFLKHKEDKNYLYIPTGADIQTVEKIIRTIATVKDTASLGWMMNFKKRFGPFYPGKYEIHDSLSNNEMIQMLKAGNRLQVKLTILFFRKPLQLAEKVANSLEADFGDLIIFFNENDYLNKFGFNNENVLAMFIPNTYFFDWNTSAEQFMERMFAEYQKFWTVERMQRCDSIGLTPIEVITLASIVDRETARNKEKPRIAGVYMNRLKKGMPLQADPTVIYAADNFSIKRVKRSYTKIDSPYNTYMNTGLPPGPICTPSIQSIDAVLHYEKHSFLYFCAKEDFSGYHNFSTTFEEHQSYAILYRQTLNDKKIE